jgi:tetratricopeptide (TPR) repeat protein
LGVDYATKNDMAKAIMYFDMALRLSPNSAEAYYKRGVIYAAMGKKEKAITDWEKVLQIEPGHEYALNNLTTLREDSLKK